MPQNFIPPHGGYEDVLSFQKARIVYDGTVKFCERFLEKRTVIVTSDHGHCDVLKGTGCIVRLDHLLADFRQADLGKEWMSDPEFRAEYDALAEEFALAEALVDARANTNLTQDQIAERMGTSRTAVVRLESGRGNPSLRTLRRYAEATGTRLRLSFVPQAPTAAR